MKTMGPEGLGKKTSKMRLDATEGRVSGFGIARLTGSLDQASQFVLKGYIFNYLDQAAM
jgi:hypothetical protein